MAASPGTFLQVCSRSYSTCLAFFLLLILCGGPTDALQDALAQNHMSTMLACLHVPLCLCVEIVCMHLGVVSLLWVRGQLLLKALCLAFCLLFLHYFSKPCTDHLTSHFKKYGEIHRCSDHERLLHRASSWLWLCDIFRCICVQVCHARQAYHRWKNGKHLWGGIMYCIMTCLLGSLQGLIYVLTYYS